MFISNYPKFRIWIWILIISIISITSILIFFQYTVDDAYITFRHSLNLVENGNISWNLSGPREEVFTNPIYVLFGTIGIKLGIKPELPIKVLSLGLFYFWLIRVIKLCNPSTKSKKLCVASLFLLCIQSYFHIFAGLETLLFAYLLFEYLICDEIGKIKDLSIGCLLMLCRPEGIIFVLLSLSRFFVKRIKKELFRINFKSYKEFIYLIIIISTIFIFTFKFIFFGNFFPNSFYSKTINAYESKKLIFSIYNIFKNFLESSPWLFLFVIAYDWSKFKDSQIYKISLFGIIYLVYLLSTLVMNYGDRFWYQLFWPLILYSITSNVNFKTFFSFLKIPIGKFKNFAEHRSFLLSLAGIFWMITQLLMGPKELFHKATYIGRLVRAHATIGKLLDKYLPSNASIFVGDAGLIPYYSRRMTYDPKLGTKELIVNGLNSEFLENKKPDVFILYSSGCSSKQTYKSIQTEELNFIELNNYKYLGGFWAAKKSCYNIYASENAAKFLDNKNFSKAKDYSLVNKRKERVGFIQDIKLSYRYLFSKGFNIPNIRN